MIISIKYLKLTLLFLVLAELLSFFGWLLPQFNTICFFVILFITLILSLEKLEYGIYILLAELFVGSKGYLFSLEFGETLVSIRIGLFLVVMGVWLYRVLSVYPERRRPRRNVGGGGAEGSRGSKWSLFNRILRRHPFGIPPQDRLGKYYLALAVVVIWAFIWGIIRGNDFGNVFLDFNNWLFFLLIFPLYDTFHRGSDTDLRRRSDADQRDNFKLINNILQILLACVIWLGIKSIVLLYIFSHQFVWALPEVYQWVRDTGVGEVTLAGSSFYRVFIQSQIYVLLLFFILLINPKFKIRNPEQIQNSNIKIQNNSSSLIPHHSLLILCLTTVILSWSRSYWVGLAAGLVLFFLLLVTRYGLRVTFLKSFVKILLVAGISLAIVFLVINLPPKVEGQDLASLIGKRATEMEAASSSRLNQLKPLVKEIIKHPIIGSGFGTTVTYKTDDPRLVPATAGGSGEFTTYAFEWGYLDMLLKFGAVGLFIYLTLIYQILKRLLISNSQSFGKLRTSFLISNKIPDSKLKIGFGLALIALLVVNIFITNSHE